MTIDDVALELIAKIHGELLYVDIDNTLCISNTRDEFGELDYTYSTPIEAHIKIVNALFEHNTIVLYTARGNRTGKKDWSFFTKRQMTRWGVKYHELRCDKPHYDFMICDKTFNNFSDFLQKSSDPAYKNRFDGIHQTD